MEKTWGDLMKFIKEKGFDQDEYFSFSVAKEFKETLESLIWTDKTIEVAVSWVVGGSEGYYVHVRRIFFSGRDRVALTSPIIALGKFWDWERAVEVTGEV